MFKIKQSYGKCEECALINEESCILETNTNGNLDETEVLFIAENPAENEIEAERPLIGQAGKTFRKPFDEYLKDVIKYTIGNVVLCITRKPDGKIGNPTAEIINCCKPNLFKLIEICKPKLIFCMGKSASSIFGLGLETNFLKKCYNFYDWNGQKIFLAPHPSYINNNGGLNTDVGKEFFNSFKEIRKYLGKGDLDNPDLVSFSELSISDIFSDEVETKVTKTETISNSEVVKEVQDSSLILYQKDKKEPPLYRIDEKFYSSDYRLVDVQYLGKHNRVIYIFRDKDNKKVFYEPPAVTNNYYYFESSGNGKIIESFENLQVVQTSYKDRKRNLNCYESDVPIEVKHAVDYYLQTKEEPQLVKQNIFFHDIEVYTYDDRSFPEPSKAAHPIVLISFALDDSPIETYLLRIDNCIDKRLEKWIEEFEGKKNVTIFNSETLLIEKFLERMHQLQPDIITAWNVAFDLGYIYNRMDKLGINKNKLSKFDDCFIDPKSFTCMISGYIVIDMMTLYKGLRQSTEDSYSLEAVSQKILGKGKHDFSCPWFELYEKYIDEFVIYNIQDVRLLVELNEALRHIEMNNELRVTATTTCKGASSTIGQAEGLFLTNLKKRGLCARNRRDNVNKGVVAGAYVKEPVGGKYEWIVDFDFTSLYPNMVRSWNIGPNTYLGKIDEDEMFNIIYNRNELDLEKQISYISDPIHSNEGKLIKIKDLLEIVKENKATLNLSGCIFKGHEVERSVFYEIYNFLLDNRKLYKKLKFQETDKVKKQVYDNKQWALKILANSLYGVLLNEYFRFYNPDLGYSITRSGVEAIKFSGYHLNQYMEKGKFSFEPDFEKRCDDSLTYLHYVDTDSLFIKIGDYITDKKIAKEITPDIILKTIAEINPILNKTILGEFVERHNINKEYSYLELKQEIIADKAYFLNTKKRYATHIINQEGNKVDYIDIKGIETQRSDFSKGTRLMLKEVLNKILLSTEVDIDEIIDFVEKRKLEVRDMCEKGDPQIGKPVGFGKTLNEYKTIPRAVKGMLLWNHLCYDYFKPGNKGIEISILGIDLSKAPDNVKDVYHQLPFVKVGKEEIPLTDIKSIVIPEMETKIPDYFIIDVKDIIRFSTDDRVDLLLEPLIRRSSEILSF